MVTEEPRNSTEPVKDGVGAWWSAAARRFARPLLPPPLGVELTVELRACCETVMGAVAGCASALYGEGRAMLVRWAPGRTCTCGESTTARLDVGVRGEKSGRLSGSVEPCLRVVLPVVNPAGFGEMTC